MILTFAGCGGASTSDPFSRVDVNGTVKVDGQPVEFGTISFSGEKHEGTQDVAQAVLSIRGGNFNSAGSGTGATAGQNDVSIVIYGSDPAAATPENPDISVTGTWAGQYEVKPGEPLTIEISSADMVK